MDETYGRHRTGICYEVHYIQEEGLKLLLAGLGQAQWYGLFSKKNESAAGQGQAVKEGVKNKLLAQLYQDGVIDWAGDAAALRQPFCGMLSVMLEQRVCITITTADNLAFVRCCYLSCTGVVMTHRSQREDGMIGMAQLSVSEWIRFLTEQCTRLEAGECCSFIWRSSESGSVLQSIQVQREGLRAFRIEMEAEGVNGSSKLLHCMQEDLASCLEILLCRPAEHTGSSKQNSLMEPT